MKTTTLYASSRSPARLVLCALFLALLLGMALAACQGSGEATAVPQQGTAPPPAAAPPPSPASPPPSGTPDCELGAVPLGACKLG